MHARTRYQRTRGAESSRWDGGLSLGTRECGRCEGFAFPCDLVRFVQGVLMGQWDILTPIITGHGEKECPIREMGIRDTNASFRVLATTRECVVQSFGRFSTCPSL